MVEVISIPARGPTASSIASLNAASHTIILLLEPCSGGNLHLGRGGGGISICEYGLMGGGHGCTGEGMPVIISDKKGRRGVSLYPYRHMLISNV